MEPSPPSPEASLATFFDRARREAERYGDDPWIFVRELVQNSRDAGATQIRFEAARTDAAEILVCDDDGCGMTRRDVARYLLRLYASRKSEDAPAGERAEGAVGRFGVGFWSVLRFGPAIIRVESRAGDDVLGLEVDCLRQTLREVPAERAGPGTRVTLIRPPRDSANDAAFAAIAAERIRRYAGSVRGLAGRTPPRLVLGGQVLNRTLEPRGFIGERIRGPGFEGVIGLGEKPVVRLYAHGLLVKEVASLEELLPRRGQRGQTTAPGLYPRAEINADGLEVLLDRQAVAEGQLLESIVTTCERRITRLRRRLLDRLAPLPWLRRIALALSDPQKVMYVGLAALLLVSSAGAGVLLVSVATPAERVAPALAPSRAASPTGVRRVGDALTPGVGPVINTPEPASAAATPWDLRYQGEGSPFIKIATYGRYDEQHGLLAEHPRSVGTYLLEPADAPVAYWLEVGVDLAAGEVFLLPVPAGHRVVAGSVDLEGEALPPLGATRHDEPLLYPSRPLVGVLRYATTPATVLVEPEVTGTLAGTSLPRRARDAAARAQRASHRREQVAQVAAWVQDQIDYTTDPADAGLFAASGRSWLDKVFTFQKGDCDVMNGVHVLLLREMGIPARLGVGFVGEIGGVAPDLHAWTEYWDDGWKVIDASPPRLVPGRGDGPRRTRWGGPGADDLDGAADASRRSAGGRAPPGGPRHLADVDDDQAGPTHAALPGGAPASVPAVTATPAVVVAARVGLGVLFGGALLALLGAGLHLLRERRGRTEKDDDEDKVATALLEHLLEEAGGADPLQLRHRPFFRTVRGRKVSLARVEALGRRGLLFASRPESDLLPALSRDLVVLDAEDPRVARFGARFSGLVRLHDVEELLRRRDRHPALEDVERVLRQLDDGVRVHCLAGRTDIGELALPVAAGSKLPPRHLLVGLADPAVRDCLALWEHDRPLARFRLASRVLERTTLYLEAADGLLARLAREALPGGLP